MSVSCTVSVNIPSDVHSCLFRAVTVKAQEMITPHYTVPK